MAEHSLGQFKKAHEDWSAEEDRHILPCKMAVVGFGMEAADDEMFARD